MTLREKFETCQLSKGVGKEFLDRRVSGEYICDHIEHMWRGCQDGHAEGIKEAVLRCAKIADRESRVWGLI